MGNKFKRYFLLFLMNLIVGGSFIGIILSLVFYWSFLAKLRLVGVLIIYLIFIPWFLLGMNLELKGNSEYSSDFRKEVIGYIGLTLVFLLTLGLIAYLTFPLMDFLLPYLGDFGDFIYLGFSLLWFIVATFLARLFQNGWNEYSDRTNLLEIFNMTLEEFKIKFKNKLPKQKRKYRSKRK